MAEEMHKRLAQAVIDGEPEDAEALAKEALDQGLDPLGCITEGLTVGIQTVGKLFASGEYYLPDLIIGADAMKFALDVLYRWRFGAAYHNHAAAEETHCFSRRGGSQGQSKGYGWRSTRHRKLCQ